MDFNKDYYNILGVDKSATDKDIKKAYRKLAVKWHPDKFVSASEDEQKEAQRKMQDINEAYDILSDAVKKQEYDAGPQAAFNPWAGFGGMYTHGRRAQQNIPIGRDCGIVLEVTWDDILAGGIKRDIEYHKNCRCEKCQGTGGEDIKTCAMCGGTGVIVDQRREGNMFIQQQGPCHVCGGRGKIVGKVCSECNGDRLVRKKVSEYLELPLYYLVHKDVQLNAGRLGHESTDARGMNGNLLIKIRHNLPEGIEIVQTSEEGFSIVNNMKIPYYDLILGTDVTVETPTGKKVNVKIPAGTAPGKDLRLKGQGIKLSETGDYYIVPIVDIPNHSDEQMELLNKLKESFEQVKE